VTVGLVTPAFLRFEPARDGEQAGPVLLLLGAAGFSMLLAGAVCVARAVLLTRRLRRHWLASASTLPSLTAEMPTHLIDVPYPLVAIVGILRPVLVVSGKVAGGCSADEVRLIAAHERAHLHARDNLKRLIIDGCPDLLRWTRTGRDIAEAWAASAEDAADDAATHGDRHTRIALAGVLLRVARMAVTGSPAPFGVAQGSPEHSRRAPGLASALVDPDSVERRVRRLAEGSSRPSSHRGIFYVVGVALAVALTTAATNHQLLAATYAAAELLVGLGR
jgi:beta-lactamase regulating signal transducer with metallopeptidase domain